MWGTSYTLQSLVKQPLWAVQSVTASLSGFFLCLHSKWCEISLHLGHLKEFGLKKKKISLKIIWKKIMSNFVVTSVPSDELASSGARVMNKFVPHHTTNNISVTFDYDIKFSSKYSQYYHIPLSPFHAGLILSIENLDVKSFTLYAREATRRI